MLDQATEARIGLEVAICDLQFWNPLSLKTIVGLGRRLWDRNREAVPQQRPGIDASGSKCANREAVPQQSPGSRSAPWGNENPLKSTLKGLNKTNDPLAPRNLLAAYLPTLDFREKSDAVILLKKEQAS
jgi:hypothetical protein